VSSTACSHTRNQQFSLITRRTSVRLHALKTAGVLQSRLLREGVVLFA
jgi:hypothetical protein